MNDTFTEQLVVKHNTANDKIKLAVYLLLIFMVPAIFILLGVTVNFYFIIVALCAFFFAIYGSYYLVTGMYLEYEYAVTNSNITIDKVIAKRSRKRIISVDIKRFNTFKKLKDSDFENKKYKKVFKASVTPDGDDVYGAEMYLEKFGGDCLLLFSPDEKTIGAMKPYIKRTAMASGYQSNAQIKAKNDTQKSAKSKTDKKSDKNSPKK